MPEPYRVVSALPTGTAFSRFVMVKAMARGDVLRELQLAERLKDSPTVHATIELQTKAAIALMVTTDATAAGPLAVYKIAGEYLGLERGKPSILGTLIPQFRRVPFRTKVPRETGSGTGGAWIGEGLATPAAATAYDTLTQEAYKAGKIVVLSEELLRLGDLEAERTVRETVAAGVAAYLDAQFLTNTVTLSANLRPAAITNGATAITSTGSSAAQINADLAGMLAAITTTAASLVWIMPPMTGYRIAATIGGTAAVDVPRTLFGIPLILSKNSPAQITLVDANCILYSDTGGVDISISTEAAIEMNDAPANPPVAGTIIETLYPRNLFGVRVTRWLAYPARANRLGRLHDGGLLMAAPLKARKRSQPVPVDDPGLQEIAAWRSWFVGAHETLLKERGLTGDEFAREFTSIQVLADNITARMRSDYLATKRTQS